ncbi:hypothetical protein GCM10010363_40270 [Streptomyces omiyaensis]|nr:hypothetical protein GCM10010363_40270 [Streptomyces omiyaensis]
MRRIIPYGSEGRRTPGPLVPSPPAPGARGAPRGRTRRPPRIGAGTRRAVLSAPLTASAARRTLGSGNPSGRVGNHMGHGDGLHGHPAPTLPRSLPLTSRRHIDLLRVCSAV